MKNRTYAKLGQVSTLPKTRVRKISALVIMVIALAMLTTGTTMGVDRAWAILHDIAETGKPGFLSLRADHVSPNWQNMQPGDEVHWQIEASLSDAVTSTLSLELRAEGELMHAGEMFVSVLACDREFMIENTSASHECATNVRNLLTYTRLSSIADPDRGEVFRLAELHASTPRYLLVTFRVSPWASPQEISEAQMRVGVGLHASGESATETSKTSEELVITGTDVSVLSLFGGGFIAMLAGVLLLSRGRSQE